MGNVVLTLILTSVIILLHWQLKVKLSANGIQISKMFRSRLNNFIIILRQRNTSYSACSCNVVLLQEQLD